MAYEIQLEGDQVEFVAGADAYVQEGTFTTFFQGQDGDPRLVGEAPGELSKRRHRPDSLAGRGR